MARKTKYSPEVQKRITDAIKVGSTYELAAQYGGITYETFRVWMESNAVFSAAVKEAEGVAAIKWLAQIDKAASDGVWQAAAWKLERRYPNQYGKTVQDVNVKNYRLVDDASGDTH